MNEQEPVEEHFAVTYDLINAWLAGQPIGVTNSEISDASQEVNTILFPPADGTWEVVSVED